MKQASCCNFVSVMYAYFSGSFQDMLWGTTNRLLCDNVDITKICFFIELIRIFILILLLHSLAACSIVFLIHHHNYYITSCFSVFVARGCRGGSAASDARWIGRQHQGGRGCCEIGRIPALLLPPSQPLPQGLHQWVCMTGCETLYNSWWPFCIAACEDLRFLNHKILGHLTSNCRHWNNAYR